MIFLGNISMAAVYCLDTVMLSLSLSLSYIWGWVEAGVLFVYFSLTI